MNIVPDDFQRHLSKHDLFVADLSLDDVQRIIVDSDSHRRTEAITSDFVRGVMDRYLLEIFGPEPTVDKATLDQATRNIEAACCRRMAFSMMGVSSVPKPTKEEIYYRGEANDGSFWYISRSAIVADMVEHEKNDDEKWPRPITDAMVEDWLGDNSHVIDGWTFDCIEAPKDDDIIALSGGEVRAPRLGR